MTFQVTRRRCVAPGDELGLSSARADFERQAFLKLPQFLAGEALDAILDALDRAAFRPRAHAGIGLEDCIPSGAVSGTLEFLLNDRDLLRAVSALTGCGPIGCFEGRVYRLAPGTAHYDSWHSDAGAQRLVGLSLNLSREPFEGGALQLRRADSDAVTEIENRRTGDAVLFRIDPALRHRVAPVVGRLPRTAYAGWFRSAPDYRLLWRERLQSSLSPVA